jgi:3-oxoacyl-[acyl-carrier protein] reductase
VPRLSTLSRSIAGKVALVTGAASGMGRATAHLFADEGAAVAVLDRDAQGVARVVAEIEGAGGRAKGYALDVSDGERLARLPEQTRADLGPLDILVNNAGISMVAPAGSADYEEHWERAVAVNLTAHIRLINAYLAQLERNADGRVVNVASTEGLGATAGISPYTATKHGVVGLTRSLAVELGARGITVNCICPGPIHTGMTSAIPDDLKQRFARRRVPLRRYGDPEEVAQVTLSVALPASSYLNGAIIPVDGGLIAKNT